MSRAFVVWYNDEGGEWQLDAVYLFLKAAQERARELRTEILAKSKRTPTLGIWELPLEVEESP